MIRKGGVLPTQIEVHDSRCCKPLVYCPLAPCKGGVLPSQTPVPDSRCCKPLLSCPSARGESCPNKLQCMTPDVAKHFSPDHSKGGVLPTQIEVHDSRCCKPLVYCPLAPCKGGVLPSQTPVHDSRCCKPLLSCPSARGESYPPKLQRMTPDVANYFYPSH